MKSQIIKLIALIALLTGSSSLSAQNIKTNSAFAIDKNIILFEVANLVDKAITECSPTPNDGGQNAFSPHIWKIMLIMAEGTDVTSLSPVITLAPGVTLTSRHASVQDFSKPVDYTVIAEDGSTVTYKFLAFTQEKKRSNQTITISCFPFNGGSTDPAAGTYSNDKVFPVFCMATPSSKSYRFGYWDVWEYSYASSTTAAWSSVFNPLMNLFSSDLIYLDAYFLDNPKCTVTVQSEDTNKGTVSGGGTCYADSSVTVYAFPKPGYTFEGWYLNPGAKISSSETFIYSPIASCTLLAKFQPIPPLISGPYLICPSSDKTYSATNWIQGYYWDKSNNLSLSNNTLNSTTVTQTGSSGIAWVSVKSSNGVELNRYYIWIGGTPIVYYITGPSYTSQSRDNYYYAQLPSSYDDLPYMGTSNILTYEWKIDPYASLSYYTHSNPAVVDFTYSMPGTYYLSCRVSDGCDISGWVDYEIQVGYQKSSVYPNPVSDILNVEPDQSRQAAGSKLAYDIRLYDAQGNQALQTTITGRNAQLNVSNLPNGIYYLHIYDGQNSKPEVITVIVKH